MRKKIHKRLYESNPRYAIFMDKFKAAKINVWGGIPVYLFFKILIRNINRDNISLQASSIAFNFFLSLIPALIFLFTLLPYFPLQEVKRELMLLLSSLLPYNAYETIDTILQDILENPRGNLLSFGLIAALYFSSNGVFALMETFNKYDKRGFIKRRTIAILLTLALGAILLVDLSILLLGQLVLKMVLNSLHIGDTFIYYTAIGAQWFMMFVLIFTASTLMYYFGEVPNEKWKFLLPGAFVTTLFTMITSLGFAYYVEQWGNYNAFYGSLGALIIIMLWLYFNSMVIIIGHEFNRSLKHVHKLVHANPNLQKDRPVF